MPANEVARVVTAVASALDYANKQGLLHRDVKPANIMLTKPDGDDQRRVLLGDFGIARSADEISGLTATNSTVGTVAYAAPEQLMGDQIDGRADQYALAATAYHLLTGTQLFPNSNPAVVISRHLNAVPPPVSTLRPDLTALDPVLAKALSKDPADRYPRCGDFARAFAARTADLTQPSLSASTAQAPIPPNAPAIQAPPAAPTPGPGPSRRRWLIPGAIAAGFVVLAGVAAITLWADTNHTSASSATETTSTSRPATTTSTAPSTTPQTPPPAPPPKGTQPPQAVTLPTRGGTVFAITRSGKTACQVTYGDVGCQVEFTIRTPLKYGIPANGVTISARGEWDWLTGDIGNQDFNTLDYGITYRALGWTITPTSEGTTFLNDATGHGMTVSVEGFTPF
jgi:serine/threonine protein kinase, bacterial